MIPIDLPPSSATSSALSSAFRLRAALLFMFLVAVVFTLYGSALDNFWFRDDTVILKQAVLYSPYEYFLDPGTWRTLSVASLTPCLTLAYDLDYSVFGFNPAGFYAHNLLAIALCAFFLFLLARQWVDEWHAA